MARKWPRPTEAAGRVDPDAARFVLGATVEGQGSSVQATNATGIDLRMVDGGTGDCAKRSGACLQSGPFTIAYQDEAGLPWTLTLPALTWQL